MTDKEPRPVLSPWSAPPGVDLPHPAVDSPPAPPVIETAAEHGQRPRSPLSAIAGALLGLGLIAAPQAQAVIMQTVEPHFDVAAREEVASIYLHVRGLLELRVGPAQVHLEVNPAAVAAVVLAYRAPEVLKALLRGRELRQWLRGERLRPSDLEGARQESLTLVERIRLAPEAVREEVKAYFSELGIEDAAALEGEIETCVRRQITSGYDVFLSYSHRDGGELARLIKARLEREGLRVFWDGQSITPGDDWYAALQAHVSASRVMVALITRHFDASWWQKEEVLHKVNLLREDPAQHRIVPILIDDPGAAFGLLQLDALRYRQGEQAEPVLSAIVAAVRAAG